MNVTLKFCPCDVELHGNHNFLAGSQTFKHLYLSQDVLVSRQLTLKLEIHGFDAFKKQATNL